MNIVDFKSIKTTRIAILGDLETAKKVWVVLHGYGQLVQFFIRKFRVLENNGIAVIAPEAQSRFYNNGFSGRVGATWMTKEDRETDIKDYLNYLDEVYHKFKLEKKDVTLLGFSQGGATASRWNAQNPDYFSKFILWASVFPDDFDMKKIDNSKNLFVMGNEDEFMNESKVEIISKMKENKVPFLIFNGGHDIYPDVLMKCI